MATGDFIFLEGYAFGKGYKELLLALNTSNKLHGDTLRKDGSLYITHPTAVTATAVRLGIEDEKTLCIMQLHDVIEDCNVDEQHLIHLYGFSPDVARGVKILSKDKKHPISMEAYMKNCLDDPRACLAKIGDRAHNISTMFDGFSIKKQKEYIEETKYILDLCKKARRLYPQYGNYILEMKKRIYDICDITSSFIKRLEEKDAEIEKLKREGL